MITRDKLQGRSFGKSDNGDDTELHRIRRRLDYVKPGFPWRILVLTVLLVGFLFVALMMAPELGV